MGKEIKKKHYEKQQKNNIVASMIILVIMVLSVAGFAMVGSTGHSEGSDTTPANLAFQQFTDPNSGQIFWGAIVNTEQFIFTNITGYDEDEEMSALALSLRSKEEVDIVVDPSYEQKDAVFVVERALKAHRIKITRAISCTENSLVFTSNISSYEDCIVFSDDYRRARILEYHLVQ